MYVNFTLFFGTTLLTVMASFSSVVVKYTLNAIFQETNHLRDIREEISAVRTEMSKISMMDEFAKHARLQRKLIKLQDELKSEKMIVSSTKLKYKVLIGSGAYVSMGLGMLLMAYVFRSEPVLILPDKWLSPFSWIISWPCEFEGAVSTLFWISVCGSASRLVASKF
ncbi:guided entry of tail-anchored proteins factor 1-like [Thrips palmi]|uniref:Guided entry of tail-anchored proteins factor 1 n=1 Tax=Thrips palmi TaxID=161013 RepID=A0A6P8YVP5_THRPL|nr:guided entry of tail-anchored proteins factor 1-like [Thrips palmi]